MKVQFLNFLGSSKIWVTHAVTQTLMKTSSPIPDVRQLFILTTLKNFFHDSHNKIHRLQVETFNLFEDFSLFKKVIYFKFTKKMKFNSSNVILVHYFCFIITCTVFFFGFFPFSLPSSTLPNDEKWVFLQHFLWIFI